MAFTVSRTEGGKWLLYSQGKLIKPYDYVPSDYEAIIKMLADEDSVEGREHVPKSLTLRDPIHRAIYLRECGCPSG